MNWLIAGTGWQTKLEQEAIACALEKSMTVAAVFDHWINYSERMTWLTRDLARIVGITTDRYAFRILETTLPKISPVLWPNALLEETKRELSAMSHSNCRVTDHILVLGEPVNRSRDRIWGQPESSIIDYIPRILSSFSDPLLETPVVLRLHPSESDGKYDQQVLASKFSIQIVRGSERSLAQDLYGARFVLGITSYALFLATSLGYPAFSMAPSLGIRFPFPPGTVTPVHA